MLTCQPPKATVQHLLQSNTLVVEQHSNAHVQAVLHRLSLCRTKALGYHLFRCADEECGHQHYQYHSCRDRHCPQCGALKKQQWIQDRTRELLPTKYYHVVFTLPSESNSVVMGNRKALFKLLFEASAGTLLAFGRDEKYLGARLGIISVLHTWGQQLSFHPHIHSIVSGGGITREGTWKGARKNDYRFLFPVKALSVVYRGKFLAGLKRLIQAGVVTLPEGVEQKALFSMLYQKPWVVYSKAPFGGPSQVIEYLGRYTHKVAISNHRIQSIDQEHQQVTFQYKDYRSEGKQKEMTLQVGEFLRRFSEHILPRGFTKIRSYGYLANRGKEQRIKEVLLCLKLPQHPGRIQLPLAVRLLEGYGVDLSVCPVCGGQTMRLLAVCYYFKGGADG
jgi:Putative transposase/Transposase zinc-binding domain